MTRNEMGDALDQAARVRRGEVTSAELLEAAIARAEALNPQLNSITLPLYAQARAAVSEKLPQGLYTGVPFWLKDIGASFKGVPTSAGSRLFDTQPAAYDSEVTLRLKAAGLVIFGKTNTPEFGSLPTTEPLLTGPTHNPWSLAHSAGGSSGGSAAAVAARIVPAAHGTDGAGSIRIPASCCGVVGLKPTRARITGAPDVGESIGGISSQGVITVTVRDSAALRVLRVGRVCAGSRVCGVTCFRLTTRLRGAACPQLAISIHGRPQRLGGFRVGCVCRIRSDSQLYWQDYRPAFTVTRVCKARDPPRNPLLNHP